MQVALLVFLLSFSLFFTPSVFAKGLDVSKTSSFSSADLNFSAGENVYVRVEAPSAPSHVLSIKDNNYSTISSVVMIRNGDKYTASFAAPGGAGYYSLEAKIEGDGVSVTSVKTIKVGSPSGANVKVNVNSSVKGTSKTDRSESQKVGKSEGSDVSDRSDESDRSDVSDRSDDSDKSDNDEPGEDIKRDKGVFESVFSLIDGVLKFFRLV